MHMEPSNCIRSGASTSERTTPAPWARVSTTPRAPSIRSRDAERRAGVLLERLVQLVHESLLARRIANEGLEPGHERGPGLQVVAHGVRHGLELVDVVDIDGLHHVDALREVPVQRADSDAGLPGDGLHGRTATLLVEDLAGGRDQELVVTLGVGPHGRVAAASSPRSIVVVVSSVVPSSSCVPSGQSGLPHQCHQKHSKKQSCKTEGPSVY